jgi:hypothetical protein
MISSNVSISLSKLAEAWIRLDGKPFSLAEWPMHREFYDGRYRRLLFKTSRQVAKSTTLANFGILECSVFPHFSTVFVSPTKEQTQRFSATRVGKTLSYSPIINKTFLRTDLTSRVFHKQFSNGSEMLFTYGQDDPDRLRGPSADRIMYDEIQDMLYDPVVLVGNETLSESDYAFETYAGTPKSMENTIQYLWEKSTQSEWVMKCSGCNTHQFIDNEKALGKRGPICVKCGKYLNPYTGTWIDMSPVNIDKDEDIDSKLKGLHVHQLIMPRNCPIVMASRGPEAEKIAIMRWKRILTKYDNGENLSTFRNEVLGVSDALGTRMLSVDELRVLCCFGRSLGNNPSEVDNKGIAGVYAGVDWSGGGTKGVSRTVLWIKGHRPTDQKLVTLYYKIYPGKNPVEIVEEIAQTCKAFRVAMVVGDAGEGHLANAQLAMYLGRHLVTQVQYGSQKIPITWNNVDRYLLDRTVVIDNYFMHLKRGAEEFAKETQMKQAIDDIMNTFEEVTRTGKRIWTHSPSKPDDALHAGLFAWLAFRIVQGDLVFRDTMVAVV